jgi:hypothetical protein
MSSGGKIAAGESSEGKIAAEAEAEAEGVAIFAEYGATTPDGFTKVRFRPDVEYNGRWTDIGSGESGECSTRTVSNSSGVDYFVTVGCVPRMAGDGKVYAIRVTKKRGV